MELDQLIKDLELNDDNLYLALLDLSTNHDLDKNIATLMILNNKLINCKYIEVNEELEEYLRIQNQIIKLFQLFMNHQNDACQRSAYF